MALLHERGELKVGETFYHKSIIGTVFTGRIVDTVTITDNMCGIVPEISGRGWVTSITDVIVEPDDPLPIGYTVSDIWQLNTHKYVKNWLGLCD